MKLDPEVAAGNRKMARDCLILSLLMAVGFLIVRRFDLSVVYGLLIGLALAVGNYYFLSVGVTRALSTGDEFWAKRMIRQSFVLRTAVMLTVIGVSVWIWTKNEAIHWVPVVASVFYPRIVLGLRETWKWYRHRNDPPAEGPDDANEPEPEEEEDGEDEFEKFVSHFSKGPVPGAGESSPSSDGKPARPTHGDAPDERSDDPGSPDAGDR